jgi:hypothetical protein
MNSEQNIEEYDPNNSVEASATGLIVVMKPGS